MTTLKIENATYRIEGDKVQVLKFTATSEFWQTVAKGCKTYRKVMEAAAK